MDTIVIEPLKLDIREIINNGINKIKKIGKEIGKELKYIFEKETNIIEFFFDLFLSYPVQKIFSIIIHIISKASKYLSFKKITLFLYYTGLIISHFIRAMFWFFKQIYYWIKFIRLHLIHKTMVFNREETLEEIIWNKTAKERGKNKIIKYKMDKVWEDEDFYHPYLDVTYFMYREYIKYTFFLLLHHYKYAWELLCHEVKNFRIYYETVSYLRRHSLKKELMKYADYLDQLAINFSIYKIFNMDTFVYYINIGINNFYENIKIIFQEFEEFHMNSKTEKGPFGDLEKRSAKYKDPGKAKGEYDEKQNDIVWPESRLPMFKKKSKNSKELEVINDPEKENAVDITPKGKIKGPGDCSKNKIKNQKSKISYFSNEDLNKIGSNKPSDDPKNVTIDIPSDTSKKDETEGPGDCPEKKLLDHSKKEDNSVVNIPSEKDKRDKRLNKKFDEEISKIIPSKEVDEKLLKIIQSSKDKIKDLILSIENRKVSKIIRKNGRVIIKGFEDFKEEKEKMNREMDEKLLKIIQSCKDEIKDPNLFNKSKKKEDPEDCTENVSSNIPKNKISYVSHEDSINLNSKSQIKDPEDCTKNKPFKEKKRNRQELQIIEENEILHEKLIYKFDAIIFQSIKLNENNIKIILSGKDRIKDLIIYLENKYENSNITKNETHESSEQRIKKKNKEITEKLFEIIRSCKDEIKNPNIFNKSKKKEPEDCTENVSSNTPKSKISNVSHKEFTKDLYKPFDDSKTEEGEDEKGIHLNKNNDLISDEDGGVIKNITPNKDPGDCTKNKLLEQSKKDEIKNPKNKIEDLSKKNKIVNINSFRKNKKKKEEEKESIKEEPVDDNPCHILKESELDEYLKGKTIWIPPKKEKEEIEEPVDDNSCHILKESELDEYLKDKNLIPPKKEKQESVKEEPTDCTENVSSNTPKNKISDVSNEDFINLGSNNKVKDPEIFDQDEYTKEEILIREEKEKLLEDINFYLENYIPKNNNEEKIKNERKDIWYQMLLKKQKNYLKYKPDPNRKQFKYKEDINQYFKKYIPETPYEQFMKDNLPDEWREFLLKKQEYHKLFENRKSYKLKKKVPKKRILNSYDLFLKWAEGTNNLPRYDYEDEPNPNHFQFGKIPEEFIDTLFDISYYHHYYLPKNDEEKKLKQGPYSKYEKFLREKQKEDLSTTPSDFLPFEELDSYQEDINLYIKHQKPRNAEEKFLKENVQEHWLKILKNIQRKKGILCGKVKGKL